MTFFYKDKPVQDLPPRINICHPEDWDEEEEDRRVIASFKYSVRCFKTEQFDVCPECNEDRMGWPEGHVHKCVDAGPANPSGRRATQKLKCGEKKRTSFAGWKKRKREKQETHNKEEGASMEFMMSHLRFDM